MDDWREGDGDDSRQRTMHAHPACRSVESLGGGCCLCLCHRTRHAHHHAFIADSWTLVTQLSLGGFTSLAEPVLFDRSSLPKSGHDNPNFQCHGHSRRVVLATTIVVAVARIK